MSESLPGGWSLAKLGGLLLQAQNGCGVRAGDGTPTVVLRLADVDTDGTIATEGLRVVGLRDSDVAKYALQEGDLLVFRVNGSRDIAGQVIRYNGPKGFTYCDHFIRLRVNESVVDSKFIARAFKAGDVRRQVELEMVSSAGQNTVSQGTFRDIELPIPPLNEQRRIVAKLEALQSRSRRAREALDAVPPLLEKLRQSILAAAFRGDLTKDWRAQNPNPEPASALLARIRSERRKKWEEAELAKLRAKGKPPTNDSWKAKYKEPEAVDTTGLPSTWAIARLDLIAGVVDPNPSHRMPEYVASGVRLISSENFRGFDEIDFSIGKSVTELTLAEQRARYSLRPGDFALSRIGTIGKTRFLPTSQDFCISHALVVIQPFDGINARFLRLMVASDALLEQARAGIQSVGVPDLGMDKIRAFTIPLPPREEQDAIVAKAESLSLIATSLERRLQAAFVSSGRLDQAVLGKAFRGELVPQDPNDDSADTMLARARNEAPADSSRQRPRRAKAAE